MNTCVQPDAARRDTHRYASAEIGVHTIRTSSRISAKLNARVEGQRRKQALDREAAETVEKARKLFTSDPQASVVLLEGSRNAHPDVVATLGELRGKLAQIERARKDRERQAEESCRNRAL